MDELRAAEAAYTRWRSAQPEALIVEMQAVFAAGFAAGAGQPCPECEERDRLEAEAREGLYTAFEIATEGT